MTEMVERVAQAICEASGLDWGRVRFRKTSLECARAAIEAMREPTDAMVKAAIDRDYPGDHEYSDYMSCSHEEAWRAMVDEASKNQQSGGLS